MRAIAGQAPAACGKRAGGTGAGARECGSPAAMGEAADLNRPIIESLYVEALVLADEARAAFDLSGRLEAASLNADLARIALSCEALRTTTPDDARGGLADQPAGLFRRRAERVPVAPPRPPATRAAGPERRSSGCSIPN